MIKYLINVKLPEGNRVFQTNQFRIIEGRVIFTDRNNNQKNFPEANCFIEGVEE
jgi:hypothetical protein